ncbi:response regulator transcription factor [Hahella sp. CR1]|uniref:response regulator transcription factor n=1 Tax=Hahella sp. CR1 TaxID=2992807 RepID=UPI0024425CFD|nr:response regulator transcription factor [Hahella sp. CR1]MDG9669223.1 response regulator transcription factor [Hahella sp. CR1]
MKNIKILIADDHQVFRQGLISLISNNSEIEIAHDCDNGTEALTFIENLKPDIAILDISMPGMNGLEVMSHVLAVGLNTRIIFLTMHKEIKIIDHAMVQGASGYLLKDEAFEHLLSAIGLVSQGKIYLSIELNSELATYRLNRSHEGLTTRETEIIHYISNGLSNKEIAKELHISPRTVDTHRTRLMRKLGLHRATDLVRYAIKEGLDI